MFCNKCGADNSEEAVFCQKCGAQIGGEEETKVAVKSSISTSVSDDEKQVFSIRPTLMFVKMGYVAAVLGAFLLVVILEVIRSNFGIGLGWWLPILAGLGLLLIPAYYHLRRNTVKYTLTDSTVKISEGLLSTNTRNIPLRTIQDVTVTANVFQRMLGFGDIVIMNANEADQKIILNDINSPKQYADTLLKQMRQLDK